MVHLDLVWIVVVGLFGLAVTGAATPVVRRLALRWRAVAVPGGRRNHHAPTPLLGGLAIFLPFTIVFITFFTLFSLGEIHFSRPSGLQMLSLFLACGWITFLGALDDKLRLSWKKKLVGQLFAIGILVLGGHRIEVASIPLWTTLDFGWLGVPLFALIVLLIVNAINIIDGVDGLAAGICFFAAATCAVMCFWKGDMFGAVIAACVAGSLVAFLFFNFPPASIYLGDGGSLFLGLLLGTLSASSAAAYPGQRPSTLVMLILPFVPFTAAFLDVFLAIVRRWASGRRIFSPDTDHVHHRLLEKFKKPQRVIAIFYGFSAVLCVITLAAFMHPESEMAKWSWLLFGFVLVGMTTGILKMYRVGDFKKTLENRPHFQFVSSYRSFMAAKIRTINSLDDLLGLLSTGVTDLGHDSVEVLRYGSTVCYWVNPCKRHPESPRLFQELSFQDLGLVVRWIVPQHESKTYQKFLEIIWYQVVRDVGERAMAIEQCPCQLEIAFRSVDPSQEAMANIPKH
ncbi:MAG: glycosyltransferase family 4 protein [Desulfomonilaceae bacterium]